MKRIENVRAYADLSDKPFQKAVLDLQVSTVTDLLAIGIGDAIETFLVQPGSIAQVIQAGTWGTLDDDGKWYDTDGAEITAPEAVGGDER
jgi:hypothetical protein